jgi:hypothetical protein
MSRVWISHISKASIFEDSIGSVLGRVELWKRAGCYTSSPPYCIIDEFIIPKRELKNSTNSKNFKDVLKI